MSRILFLSDTQLGAGSQLAHDRLADQELILTQAIQLAVERNADTVVHCGDVYEHRHPSEEARMVFKRFAARVRDEGLRLIVVAGNHDLRSADTPSSVDVHDGFTFARRDTVIDLGDASLACLPWTPAARVVAATELGERETVNERMSQYLLGAAADLRSRCPDDKPAILALHWWIEEASTATGLHSSLIDEPKIPLTDLAAGGFDAVIAGHVHRPQILHVDPPVLYVGPTAVCNFGEEAVEHGVWILDTDDADKVEFVELEDRRFVTVDVDLTEERAAADRLQAEVAAGRLDPSWAAGGNDETDFVATAIGQQLPLTDAVIRVRYTATEEQHRRIDTAALRKLCIDAGAHKVFQIEPTSVRSQRVRIDGFDRSLDEHSALDAWAGANKVDAQPLHEILSSSREKSASTVTTGATFDPLRLTGRNIGRFPELDVTLTDGATVLLGGNGSGKSIVLAALELALYAEDAGSLRELLSPWADGLELAMEFTLDGELHRVRRTLRGVTRSESGLASGGKATLDLEQKVEWPTGVQEVCWIPLTRESAKATQALLVQLLGMSRTLFGASCFLAQGDGPAFLKAEPRDRKAMAAELLDPAGLWAADAKYAAVLAKDTTIELTTVASQLLDREERLIGTEDLAETVASLETGEVICRDEVGKAETLLEAASAALAANSVAAIKRNTAADELRRAGTGLAMATENLRETRERADRIIPTRERLERLAEQAATVTALERQEQAWLDVRSEIEASRHRKVQAHTEARAATAAREAHEADLQTMVGTYDVSAEKAARLRTVKVGTERCELCHHVLEAEGTAATLASLDTEIAAMVSRIADKRDMLAAARETETHALAAADTIIAPELNPDMHTEPLKQARQAQVDHAALATTLASYELEAEKLPGLEQAVRDARQQVTVTEEALAKASEGVGDETALSRAVMDSRELVAHHRGRLETVTAELARAKQRQEQATQLRGELAALRGRQQLLQHHLDISRLAERAFGRDGIPVLLLETVLDQIDTDANAVLRRFPTDDGWTFQVRFETQREQATTDRVKEELYVMVEAPDYPQDFRSLSGGEESRVAFGVRVALAMLLGRLRGADSRLLVLDELSFLDEAGETRLVELINELAADGTFSKILTVSHSPNVRDAFEQTIEIEKRDGRSEIVSSLVLEAATA